MNLRKQEAKTSFDETFPPMDRQRALEVQLENRSDVAYYAQRSQHRNTAAKVFAQLDTGSFELWVNPNCSGLPVTDRRFCQAIGRYDPSNSSTAVVSELGTSLRYGIGSANITYVLDDISLGGGSDSGASSAATMKRVQFGGLNIGYDNFVDQLARQNVTRTKAFSVALGSKDERQGVVVFGGVDTSKGESPDGVARYWVRMKGMRHVAANGTATDLLAAAMGSTTMDLNGFHIVDCALTGRNGSVDFAFEGVTVRVPYRELIREVRMEPPMCYLGVMPSDMFALLGDTFLRSAYVVFDLDANMTYMAQYTNCGSTVRTIAPSSDLKSLVGECNRGPTDVNGGRTTGRRRGQGGQRGREATTRCVLGLSL
ncbi:hypothetical protein ACCO45_008896 [Purpureocillium lilacinum]|uniref:Uncharacterized protein n=1 Tax=Purpureocillium lilacinum TaxID=33203 RepID=A0ACC4DI68_PURLI